jgi:hypothetical protein
VPHRFGFAGVNIREVGPAVLAMVCLIVNYKVISKARTVIFVHSYGKFSFERRKFFASQFLGWGDQEALFLGILLIYPIRRRLPMKWAITNHNVVKLSFGYDHSIRHTVTLLMEN